MKKILTVGFCLLSLHGFSQTDSTQNPFRLSGYLEVYYTFDLGQPDNHNRPGFVYSFNRHNEVNLNIGFIKAIYEKDNVRANLALMTGTYANANLAAEPGVLKNIFEANAGVRLSKKRQLWLDAGIFASHIGFESAIGKDCWNLTRSILADNSPYYESGVKISYTSESQKWFLSGLLLNGWQRIQRPDGNNTPAFGHQLTFKPSPRISLNSSSFVGSDTPDSTRRMRYFHNFYGQFQLHDKLGLLVGFDIGAQQESKGSRTYFYWYTPVLILRYAPTEKMSLAIRGEYYHDAKGVIISTSTPNGFQTYGYSFNLDYQLMQNLVWRIEARSFQSQDQIFVREEEPSAQNYFFTTSLAFSF
ncbi:MAG: porin [Microscillaceae bacterium]|nr:porin [Microscillaceae bacterium]